MLLMARKLLHYRPTNKGYDAWLGCITELIKAMGEAQAPSHSPPPLPLRGDNAEPWQDAR